MSYLLGCLILIVLSIIIAIIYCSKFIKGSIKEGLEGLEDIKKEGFADSNCPDLLIQKGEKLYLINNKVAKVPGVNPIIFNNLEEYVEYLKWQRFEGKRCPVLYLQNSYDIQGNHVYVNRKSPFEKEGGTPVISGLDLFNNNNRSLLLDSTRNHPPYNKNLYPGFDPQDQDIGLKTPLDKLYHSDVGGVSANAMDPNWGGAQYTEDRIKAGDYKEDEVKIYIPN